MSILETIGWILIIAAVLCLIVAYWWLVWICVGILMVYFGIPVSFAMQLFLWIVVNIILGALGRVGMSAFN